jgi:YD repeat-containing protein
VTNYVYDSLNRETSLTDFASRTFTFSYDALGRRINLTRPNGVNTSYAYDNLSRLLSVSHVAGSSTLDGATYSYDAVGNRTAKTSLQNSVTSAFTYDPTYQLLNMAQGAQTKENYTYDPVGNRRAGTGLQACGSSVRRIVIHQRIG